ncbi:2-hydroxy-3-oxopropionate reductase [Hansschlegelia plantiphila]|uniref:2-hydroxy-3-oxopropionate reductase n=1 Tax=Hansschlegelia plantiphila TaxID=374655 RepID=A0A9W6MWL0_9HYPH|nr:2-hydroxy-3-oxopropionate reductase [Hansschlegelia plantiphila]GLK68937.1 2-hydroxy-3-oxopropionate reductase [Hansschlegelia plantiphila]
MKVGFIGLGLMGLPMAENLRKAGHTLYLHSRSGVPAAVQGDGMIACENPAEVASKAEVVITMVPDTPDVEKVLFGEKGVAGGLSDGKLVIDMSSISPVATKAFAKRIEELGCGYIDAPVSGGDIGAKAATLTIMVGATETDFERAKPLFEAIGKTITLVGGVGSGQTCKVANQIIVALNIQAVAEALTFASKAGADPVRVRQALLGGFASSRVLEVHAERMINRTFKPGFRVGLHMKDLEVALSNARALGVALPSTAVAQQMFNSCVANGDIDADDSILCTAIERLSGHEIAKGS